MFSFSLLDFFSLRSFVPFIILLSPHLRIVSAITHFHNFTMKPKKQVRFAPSNILLMIRLSSYVSLHGGNVENYQTVISLLGALRSPNSLFILPVRVSVVEEEKSFISSS